MRFVEGMTKINKGRAFYTTPGQIGEYVMVDSPVAQAPQDQISERDASGCGRGAARARPEGGARRRRASCSSSASARRAPARPGRPRARRACSSGSRSRASGSRRWRGARRSCALANLFLLHAPAEYALERVLPPACVEELWINCPDPWPKKRHWRRRLVQAPLLALAARARSRPARSCICRPTTRATATGSRRSLAGQSALANLHAPAAWVGERPARRETAYEAEWRAEGRTMAYFDYRRAPLKALLAHTPDELRAEFASAGTPGFRAAQVAQWLYGRRVRDFAAMANLPAQLRGELAASWRTRSLELSRSTAPPTARASSCSRPVDGANASRR